MAQLHRELAAVVQASETARQDGQPGNLFFLLRKKWALTQRLFQLENEYLLARRSRTGKE